MPKKAKIITCKKCGESWAATELETNKEWNLFSPMHDKDGNITITRMATWTCPSCGKSVMSSKGKFKSSAMKGPSKKEQLLDLIQEVDDKIAIEDLAEKISFETKNVEMALKVFIKNNTISGKIEDGFFYKQ